MRNKVPRTKDAYKRIIQVIFISLFGFIMIRELSSIVLFILLFIIDVIYLHGYSQGLDIISFANSGSFLFTILGTSIMDIFLFLYHRKASLGEALSKGYRWSIREAYQAAHPEGVVYILDNILQQFDKFGLNLPPEKISITEQNPWLSWLYALNGGIITGTNNFMGFPNRTNLREAMNMAQTLSEEWSNLNTAEKSRAMGEIRARIQTEDMLLNWNKKEFSLKNKYHLSVYSFTYIEKNHHPTPTPKNQPPANPSRVLTFDEWINQNPQFRLTG